MKQFTDNLEINFINPPREGYKLLVLDLDHTILDFSSTSNSIDTVKMKRPHMDFFLQKVYEHYGRCCGVGGGGGTGGLGRVGEGLYARYCPLLAWTCLP